MSADAPNRGAEQPITRTRFPRSLRLLKHADFDRVYKRGRRHFSSHMTVFYSPQEKGPARVGFTVGRLLGGAVERNRIRRRLREAVRLRHAVLTGPVDVVINPKKSAIRVEFSALLEEVEQAFQLIARRIAEERKG